MKQEKNRGVGLKKSEAVNNELNFIRTIRKIYDNFDMIAGQKTFVEDEIDDWKTKQLLNRI